MFFFPRRPRGQGKTQGTDEEQNTNKEKEGGGKERKGEGSRDRQAVTLPRPASGAVLAGEEDGEPRHVCRPHDVAP